MGLEIQQSVNSLMGSANQAVLNEEENVRKGLKIVLGAAKGFATGGVGGAIAGGVGEAVNIAAGSSAGQNAAFLASNSPQAQAAQQADQSAYNEIERQKAQRAQIDAMQFHEGKIGDLPESARNQIYAQLENKVGK